MEAPEPRVDAGDEPPARLAEPLARDAEVYAALRIGLGDYVRKNGFERVLVAVSGGSTRRW